MNTLDKVSCTSSGVFNCDAKKSQHIMSYSVGGGVVGAFSFLIIGSFFGVSEVTLIIIVTTGTFAGMSMGMAYGAEDDYNEAMDTNPIPSDPIIFDLNGDGLKTTDYVGYFDYNCDGFAELTKWVNNNDAILVIDSNNNNKIDNGTELVLYSDLLEYDSNQDGIIDSNDEIYSQLKLLKGDGTQLTLQDAGIQSINLDTTSVYYTDENGNIQLSQGTFTRKDGSISSFGEFGFLTNKFNSISTELLVTSEDIEVLPDIMGTGNVYSLHQAMIRNESLKTLVENFIEEHDMQSRINILEQIILKWTGAENIEEGSRGENINAKHLNAIEQFMGRDFYSQNENEENSSNPNLAAGQMLTSLYEKFKLQIYAQLMVQSHLFELFSNVNMVYESYDEETEIYNNVYFDLTNIKNYFINELETDSEFDKNKIYEFVKVLKGLGLDSCSNFFDPKDDSCFYTTFTKDDRELKWLIDTIGKVPYTDEIGNGEGSAADDSYRLEEQGHFHALSGDDVAYGSDGDDSFAMCNGDDLVDAGNGNDIIDTHGGDDIVFGGAGNDTIHASDGNDIIFGGDGDDRIMPDHGDEFNAGDGDDIIRGDKGNDHIISVLGNDTIIFQLGDGQDIVEERQGVDTLYFGPGIKWEDLIFEQSENNMIIKINNTEDQITIVDWFITHEDGVYRYDNNKIEKFEFADDLAHTMEEITIGDNTEAITYNMDEIGDWVETAGGYKTVVNIKEGWNDIYAGQNSDDTYVIDRQGADVQIHDYSGNDTIRFGEGISLARTFFAYNQDHIEIWFEDYEAHLRLRGDGSNYTRFEFADGTVVTDLSNYLERTVSYVDHIMGEREQEVELLGYDSITVIGNNMDNRIIANEGDSVINAGQFRYSS